jgi:hypothetical protein
MRLWISLRPADRTQVAIGLHSADWPWSLLSGGYGRVDRPALERYNRLDWPHQVSHALY